MPQPNFPPPRCPVHGRSIKRDSCSRCNAAYMREYMRWRRLQKPVSLLLDRARRRARQSHLPFSIDRNSIAVPPTCPALGIALLVGGCRGPGSPSLDRIIPELGYVPGNVRVISDKANRLKAGRSIEQLRELSVSGPPEWRDEYRKIAAYVDREQLLQEIRLKANRPGRTGAEWQRIADFLDRIFSRGLADSAASSS
jgi:hypothetical protein